MKKKVVKTTKDEVQLITVDFGKMPEKCSVCGKKDDDLRPYGGNNAWICYDCGMANKEQTGKVFSDVLNGKGKNIKVEKVERFK